jgi:hypothetical protein
MCFSGFSPSNSDGALFAQMCNRHLTLLPSKVLIRAGRKALVVAVEMVNYDGLFKKELNRAGTANEADHGHQQRYRRRPHFSIALKTSELP